MAVWNQKERYNYLGRWKFDLEGTRCGENGRQFAGCSVFDLDLDVAFEILVPSPRWPGQTLTERERGRVLYKE